MLGRDHHVRCAKKRVGPRRVNAQHVVAGLAREAGFLAVRCPGELRVQTAAFEPAEDGPMKKSTSAPALRPIQLRCRVLILSDQSTCSRSFSSRSA